MIRIIICLITVILFLIVGILILGVEWIIGKINKRAADISSLRIVQAIFKAVLFEAGTKLTVIGEENVPKDKAVLYVGNHSSYFDIVIAYSRMPGLCGFISKKEVGKVPLLRTWMLRLYCLFLDRENIKEGLKTILKAIEYVKAGISICIFPEGTRNLGEEMLPFKEGSLKIAEKTGCLIIPIAITNSAEILEKHFPFIKKTHVIIEYGEPIDPKSLTKEEKKFLGAYTQDKIRAMLAKNKALI